MPWIVKVREKFSSAHFLKGYKGKCENIHGHNYEVEVRIKVEKLPESGFVYDFVEIKNYLKSILPDHQFLNEIFDFNPTAEELARWIFKKMKEKYPIISVEVWEEKNSSAEYFE